MRVLPSLILLVLCLSSCKEKKPQAQILHPNTAVHYDLEMIDTTLIDAFFDQHPLFLNQKDEVKNLYRSRPEHIWFDPSGKIEFAGVLYDQALNMTNDGIVVSVPYRSKFERIIYYTVEPSLSSELLLSCLYFFYTDHVLKGLDPALSAETKWFLPRQEISYSTLLDSLVANPGRLMNSQPMRFAQYYNLRTALRKYRQIAENGGWNRIDSIPKNKTINPGDSALVINQIRARLFSEGYLLETSNSNIFDKSLEDGIAKFYEKHHRTGTVVIDRTLIEYLNIPVQERIKTITVNMERCRWISPDISAAPRVIAVNIPSFMMHVVDKGNAVFSSRVVVGKQIHETVVFSGELSYIVFSPYWNVPKSILENEIKPAIAKNPNYLAQHNMEWHNNMVRQRPGNSNSLGLVKFMFPNSNNIYLHDTPAKSLFNQDQRAFSHGCIRVEKARELAIKLMADEAGWTPEEVDLRMNAASESSYVLKKPIPVYIGYFTAWADADGLTAFYNDVYNRDERLLQMLHN